MDLYLKYLKMHFKSAMEYKMSFIMSFISQLFVFFGYYFYIICLFDKFSNVKGYTMPEILFTFGIIHFGFSFCETFFRGIDQFDDLIIEGSFDRLLTRPRNILLQVFGSNIDFVKSARFIQSIIVLFIAIFMLKIKWNILKIITLILMLISSITVFFGIFLLSATYCFYTIKGLEIRNVFTDGGKHLAQYPIGIFKKGIIFMLTFLIPYGFVNYYPLMFILGKTKKLLYVISPLITFTYLIPCILAFYKGVRKYSSVGS